MAGLTIASDLGWAVDAPSPLSVHSPSWTNGLSAAPDYFPIAVWLQDPRNAARYKAAGINLYVGLWRGPTTNQLVELQKAGMQVICGQNRAGLENKDNPTIVAWMHGDEPDNAQSLGNGKGYERIRQADPARPVLLNLGQGVAYDNYIGRGVRRNHPEDYPNYIQGADIVSFDIYPVVHDKPEVAGKLEFVARGVERLGRWTGGQKAVWNCIECTHIGNPEIKPTPEQVRTEVWMSLIHGSRGLIYFVHQFKPAFKEAALLDDPEMLAAVTEINREIRELAPVLNSPTSVDAATVESSVDEIPIAFVVKRRADSTYLLTVNMRGQPTRDTFTLRGVSEDTAAEVLGESRHISVRRGEFADEFKPYAVHLYRVKTAVADIQR